MTFLVTETKPRASSTIQIGTSGNKALCIPPQTTKRQIN